MSYQVFLSFKNSADGESTADSKIAEALYKYLVSQGVNVFFSNISLLEFGESAYKDAIDDALDEVQLMVVIGSQSQYLTSKWCKYEWQNYQQNMLSNIVKGTIVTYIGDMDLAEVPTAIRHYQSFRMSTHSVENVGTFVVKALQRMAGGVPAQTEESAKASDNQPNEEVEAFKKEKQKSAYSASLPGEKRRLAMQARLLRDADMPPVNALKEIFTDRKKIYILDMGCGYGTVVRDRFGDWDNIFVVGIDVNEPVLEKAREYNADDNRFVFEHVDMEGDSFSNQMEEIMDKYDIEAFDLIFGAYIFQHIGDPVKLLRRCRAFLKADGYVLFRNPADKSTISYGDDGLVKKIQNKTEEAPGHANRDAGIQLYYHLYTSGYKQIKAYGYFKNISNMTYDERMEIFKERFGLRDVHFKMAHLENPTDITLKNNYEWMKYALEKLEELFGNESFWYGETIVSFLAKKT